MKTYIVQYWYNTDLREELEVKANHLRGALEVASDIMYDKYSVVDWTVSPEFIVKAWLKKTDEVKL